jgi:hypothetical protein
MRQLKLSVGLHAMHVTAALGAACSATPLDTALVNALQRYARGTWKLLL